MTVGDRGVLVPLVTPVDSEGAICAEDIRGLVDSVRPFVVGLMPALSSGEGWVLSERQWSELLAECVAAAQELPVIAGIELPTTDEVIRRALTAASMGAEAVAITTPFGKHVSQEHMFEHTRAVDAALRSTDASVLIYNESVVSGNVTTLTTLQKMCELSSVIAVKESSGEEGLASELVRSGVGAAVYQGHEHLCGDLATTNGLAVSLANLAPELCRAAVRDPSPECCAAVITTAQRYHLGDDQWHVELKRELKRRGVITHDQRITTTEGAP